MSGKQRIRVMCLGDSITDGFTYAGGYRNALGAMLAADGRQDSFVFVGPNSSGSGCAQRHAGFVGCSICNIPAADSVTGERGGIAEIAGRLLRDDPADAVCLMIGTNDILSKYALSQFGERLEVLVRTVLGALPDDGMLFLATLPAMDARVPVYISSADFTPETMDAAVDGCNRQIRALAANLQAQGERIALAEMQDVLTKQELSDGVHPDAAGFAKIGARWYRLLTEFADARKE